MLGFGPISSTPISALPAAAVVVAGILQPHLLVRSHPFPASRLSGAVRVARLPGTGETRSYHLEPNRHVEQVHFPVSLRSGRVRYWPIAPRPLVELRRDQYQRWVRQTRPVRDALGGWVRRSKLPNTGQAAYFNPIIPGARTVRQAFFPYWTLGGRVSLGFPQLYWESDAVPISCPDIRRLLPAGDVLPARIPVVADGFDAAVLAADGFALAASVADAIYAAAQASDSFSGVPAADSAAFPGAAAAAESFAATVPATDFAATASTAAADELSERDEQTDAFAGHADEGDAYPYRREECK